MALVGLSVVEQRYRAVLEAAAGVPVSEVAACFGVSRQSVHAWIRRYGEGGLGGLLDRSRRPESCPHQVSAQIEAVVCELRRQHPRWGPLRLAHELGRAGVSPVLLHDAVEDHAGDLAPGAGRQQALAVLAARFGTRVADLVGAVTNPVWEPGRDEHVQYREHVRQSLRACPWARVIKASDYTDNAVGLMHATGPMLARLAGKYAPLVPVLRTLIEQPDTPLDPDVKARIAGQLDSATDRFAAIGHKPSPGIRHARVSAPGSPPVSTALRPRGTSRACW